MGEALSILLIVATLRSGFAHPLAEHFVALGLPAHAN
jgi:hypothetical protein